MPLVTQSDIEQLYAQSYDQPIELSSTSMAPPAYILPAPPANEPAPLVNQAGTALWRLLADWRQPSGRLNPSNV